MLIVICGEQGSEYLPERRLVDTDWDATVQHIAEGQFENVSSVIHSSLGRDVLDAIAREVMTIWQERGEPLTDWQRKFIEYNVSVSAANRFLQAAE
jgi:hypothetical protein